MDRSRVLLCSLLLLVVNVVIASRLFRLEYSAYHESNEGTFIAIARVTAEHPGEPWWPLWGGGMPIQNTYSQLVPWMSAAVHKLTGYSPARSFHLVGATFFVSGALTLFWMALIFSRRLYTSLIAALAYSCFSLSAFAIPVIRVDSQGAWNLRRLQVLTYYGEAPHTVALALLPITFLCFAFALTKPGWKWKVLAGLMTAAVALTNAFGIVALVFGLTAWLLTMWTGPLWKGAFWIAAIGGTAYLWISPWLPPSLLQAIRTNSPTVDGDYRYTSASWMALAIIVAVYAAVWFVMRRLKVAPHLAFFSLLAYAPLAILAAWYGWRAAVVVQPTRYHLQLDMVLLLALVFFASALLDRFPPRVRVAVVAVAGAALAVQTYQAARFARRMIRRIEPSELVEYKIAKWMDQHRHGQRAFLSGSTSFLYNVFTDNPQMHGGHDPMLPNPFLRAVVYTIYSGQNAGDRDAEFSVFWLKTFGAQAISVSGPNGREYYKPIAHPKKFEGVLKEVWRDGDDAIYEVPARSGSLAHVIPRAAIPARVPIHGLDIEPVRAYVEALEDPQYPVASFEWISLSEAKIQAAVEPGQVIAVQETFAPGWEATANGRRVAVWGDAIGQMAIEPDCRGACEVSLKFTGGAERMATRAASVSAMLIAAGYVWFTSRRKKPGVYLRPAV